MSIPEICALILVGVWWIGVLMGIAHIASPYGESADSIDGYLMVLLWPLVAIYIVCWNIFTPKEER